jgi:hypothetical protein
MVRGIAPEKLDDAVLDHSTFLSINENMIDVTLAPGAAAGQAVHPEGVRVPAP